MTVAAVIRYVLAVSVVSWVVERISHTSFHYSFFLLFFFLPGFLLLQKNNLKESLTAIIPTATGISMALFTVYLYLTSYLGRLPFPGVVTVFPFLTAGVGLAVNFFSSPQQVRQTKKDNHLLLFCLAIAVICTLPLIRQRTQLSYDSNIHIPLAYQILNGQIPPSHHAAAGISNATYWMYAALLAGVSTGLQVTPPQSSCILAFLCLLCISLLGISLSKGYLTEKTLQYLTPLLILTGTGLLFSFITVARILHRPQLIALFSQKEPFEITDIGKLYLVDGRLMNFLHKAISIDGFRLGFLFFLLGYVLLLQPWRSSWSRGLVWFFLVSATFLVHPVSSIALMGLVLCSPLFIREWKPRVSIALATLSALVITSQYLISVSDGLHTDPLVLGFDYVYLLNIFFGFLFFLPLAYDGLKFLTIQKRQRGLLLFTAGITGYLLATAVLVHLPDNNQYKLIHIAVIPLTVLTICGISFSQTWLGISGKRLVIAFFYLLICLQYGTFAYAYTFSSWRKQEGWDNRGINLESTDKNLQSVATFIRSRTPKNAVIATLPLPYDDSFFTQRQPFVAKTASIYEEGYPQFSTRRALLTQLPQATNSASVINQMRHQVPQQPLFLIVHQAEAHTVTGFCQHLGYGEPVHTASISLCDLNQEIPASTVPE